MSAISLGMFSFISILCLHREVSAKWCVYCTKSEPIFKTKANRTRGARGGSKLNRTLHESPATPPPPPAKPKKKKKTSSFFFFGGGGGGGGGWGGPPPRASSDFFGGRALIPKGHKIGTFIFLDCS